MKFFLLAARSASAWTEISLNTWHREKDLSLSLQMVSVCCGGACLQRSARPPVCAASEGQPEVRAKGFFSELLRGSLCLSCYALPWAAVTNICCKGFRAMPPVAASATGSGVQPCRSPRWVETITVPYKEVCFASPGTCGHCQCDSICTSVLHCLWRAGPLEFFNLPSSYPQMSFLLNLEFNSCIKYHRREIIPKTVVLSVCLTPLSALVLSLWPMVSL